MSEHAHAEPEAEAAPSKPEVAAPMPRLIERLQRTAGNRAVAQLLARQPAAPLDAKDMEALQAYGKVHQLAVAGADAASSAPAKREAIV